MNMRTSTEIGRLAHRFARRQFEIYPAEGHEAFTDETGQVLRVSFPADRLAQHNPCLLFHRTPVGGGANAKSDLHFIVEIAYRDACRCLVSLLGTNLCDGPG